MSGLSVNSVSSYSSPYAYAPSTGNSAATAFQNLGQALQSGNLSAARAAFSALQRTFQNQSSSIAQSASADNVVGGFSSLAQSLTSGNLTAAQAAYADLQQELQMQANTHPSVTRPAASRHS